MEPRQTQRRSGKKQLEEGVPPISGSTDTAAVHRTFKRRGKEMCRAAHERDISKKGRTAKGDVSESQSKVNHKGARKGEFRTVNAMYCGEKEVTSIRRGNSKRRKRSTSYKNKSDNSRVAYRGENQDYVGNAPVRSKASSTTIKHSGTDVHNELKPEEEITVDNPANFFYEVETVKVTPKRMGQSGVRQPEKETGRDKNTKGSLNYKQKLSRKGDPRDEKYRGLCIACWDETDVWKALCCSAEICSSCLGTYVTAKTDDGIIDIKCPGSDCDKRFNSYIIRSLVRPEKIKRLEYLQVKHGWYPHLKTCPFCDNMYDLREIPFIGFYRTKMRCMACRKAWCSHCELPWHGKMKCVDYVEQETGIREWAKTRYKNSQNAQQCPGCQVRIYIS